MTFKEKTIIITGGAGGIGLAAAKRFLELEGRVAIVDINQQSLDKAIASVTPTGSGEIIPIACDITKEDQVSSAIQTVINKWGSLDVIVNNAGLMIFKSIEEQTIDDWQKIFSVDLFGAFFFIKHGFLNMKSGSAIVNIASIHAIMTEPMVATYAAAKAALVSLTRSAALEGKPKGIRINAILPGAIDTPMLWDNPNVRSGIEKINKDDVGRPEDIADAIVYLCSPEAGFIQGAAITVDGGRLDRL